MSRALHKQRQLSRLGMTLVILAGALAPFDFGICRSEITAKVRMFFSPGRRGTLTKKTSLSSCITAPCFLYVGNVSKAMGHKKFIQATIVLGMAMAIIIEGLQLFMATRFPSWGSFFRVFSGIFAGLLTQWFASRHYRASLPGCCWR